jgi:restriction endonuclease S subunit/predicted nucleic acid-binding protein
MIFYKETNFKETLIGKIPKEWDIVKLEKICNKIKAGGTPLTTKKEFWNGDIPFVKIEDITSSGKYLTKTSNFITKIGLENSNAWIIPANSLLLAMYGSLGEVSINRINVATNQAILGIIPKEEDDVEFLYYWFLYFKPNWKRYAKPTTQANLTAEIVKNSLIPLPRQEERKKIIEILSTVDKAIQKTNEIISKTERLKRGLMQELLTRGLILGFMFDTNVFNAILNRHIDLEKLPRNSKYYITHIQYDEICSTQSEERKRELLKIMEKVPNEVIATEGAVYGVSIYGMAKYMSEADAKQYDEMLRKLKELDEKSGKKKTPENQARDILIALTCMKNCLTLVTNDNNLKKVAQDFQCSAITFEQLLKGEYREFKDTEIGKIPEDWEVVNLENGSLRIRTGHFGSQLKKSELSESGVKVYTQENILKNDFSLGNLYVSYDKFEKLKTMEVKPGDVLLTIRGSTGCSAVFPEGAERGIIHTNLAYIRVKRSLLLPEYLSLLINDYPLVKSQIITLSSATTLGALYAKHIKKIKIPLPPLQEQQKIVKILSNTNKKLEIERNEKAKLERIKQGLMDLLLTGKIRIKVN